MKPEDEQYLKIPWKDGGLTRNGIDCRGLALLWLREQMGFDSSPLAQTGDADEVLKAARWRQTPLQRGDIVFFARFRAQRIVHCAVYLGENKFLHAFKSTGSVIVNGHVLLSRLGLIPCGAIGSDEAGRLCQALADPALGSAGTIVALVISILLSVASAALNKPKLPRLANLYGRYATDGQITQASTAIPLPDLLGRVVVAGNMAYTQPTDPGQDVSDPTASKWNKIIVLGSGPLEEIEMDGIAINGLPSSSAQLFTGGGDNGIRLNPAQTKAEAVEGTIAAASNRPSITIYIGDYDISVPVDIRAQYDRNFPIYGLTGCGYLALRLIDHNKFSSFNITSRIKGRMCRTFDASGFIASTATGESLTGADGSKVRFKLANADVIAVSSLTVNATSQMLMDASHQSGNVFSLNKMKGYIEFPTAPAAAATITISYTYYTREWTSNFASQIAYLLTELDRGKALPASRLNWSSFVAARDLADGEVTINTPDGEITRSRFSADYSIDVRKPIQEHIAALLDAGYSSLFVSNGKFVLAPRTTGSSVFSFDTTNILEGSFTWQDVARNERANRVRVLFSGEDSLNAEDEFPADDEQDQEDRAAAANDEGVVEVQLKFPAVTTRDQAQILGEIIVAEDVNRRATCKFTSTLKGLAIEPMDVVDLTHPARPDWAAKLFRVETINADEDGRMIFELSEYFAGAYI